MSEILAMLMSFLKAIGKYRWYAVAVSWVVALAGWIWVFTLPPNYQANARVYVDTQSILRPLLAEMTTVPNLEQQVMFMRRTLISRPNVEKLIREVDLDVGSKSAAEHDKLVEDVTSNIKLSGTERDDIYTITYNSPNPKLARDVVQALLTMFVEGSFGGKKQDSEKAVRFIDDQIKVYEEKLTEAENALKEFKLRHVTLLPRTGTDFGAKLTELMDQAVVARQELAEAERARDVVQRRLESSRPVGSVDPSELDVKTEVDARIEDLRKNMDKMRIQFTDEHPDLQAAKRLLASLQRERAEEIKNRKKSADPGASYSPLLQQMNMQLNESEAQVARMQARVADLNRRIATLRAQSTEAPEVEAELAQLNRDYQINKENYEKLVSRREAAKLSGDLTSATDMLSFRVIDPPTVPPQPEGPNKPRLYSVVLVVALAAGLAVALGMSQVRPTFLSQSALREATGLPVLGSIGMNWTEEQKAKRRRRLHAFSMSVGILILIYGAMLAMTILRAKG